MDANGRVLEDPQSLLVNLETGVPDLPSPLDGEPHAVPGWGPR